VRRKIREGGALDEFRDGLQVGPARSGRGRRLPADAEAIEAGRAGETKAMSPAPLASAQIAGTADWRETEVAAGLVELGEEVAVGGGTGHRGVALAESDGGGGARETVGDDGAHLGLGFGELFGAGGAKVAADEGALRGDVAPRPRVLPPVRPREASGCRRR